MFSQHGLVLYGQVISRHQLLNNASIISSTGIDVNASKGETLLGYLTAIWFYSRNVNSMWDNHTGHWLQPETILTYLQRCPKVIRYMIAISQEATINYNMCSCSFCPASRTTLVATRFRVAVICPIIQVPHCIRVFFYFVWFVFINHIFQFYYELCTYCNILDIYLS